jgi:hypothetical protein
MFEGCDRYRTDDETRDGARISSLDLVGPSLTMVTGPASSDRPSRPTPFPGVPNHPGRSVDVLTARGLGLTPGGGLVVRPDGARSDVEPGRGPRFGARRDRVSPPAPDGDDHEPDGDGHVDQRRKEQGDVPDDRPHVGTSWRGRPSRTAGRMQFAVSARPGGGPGRTR